MWFLVFGMARHGIHDDNGWSTATSVIAAAAVAVAIDAARTGIVSCQNGAGISNDDQKPMLIDQGGNEQMGFFKNIHLPEPSIDARVVHVLQCFTEETIENVHILPLAVIQQAAVQVFQIKVDDVVV